MREAWGPLAAFDSTTTVVNDVALAREVLTGSSYAIQRNLRDERIPLGQAEAAMAARLSLNAQLRPEATVGLEQRVKYNVVSGIEARMRDGVGWVDVLPVLEDALSRTACEMYFGADWHLVRGPLAGLLSSLDQVFTSPFTLPSPVPSPARLRVRRNYRHARSVVDRLIADRRARANSHDDLVHRVLRRTRSTDVQPDVLADALIGSLLAAYQIPAAAAAWALLELAQRPAWQEEIATESRQERAPEGSPRARRHVTVANAVALEVLRLHPPTWAIHRTAMHPVSLGGFDFQVGHHFVVSPYVLQRDPQTISAPDAFDPRRWLGGRTPPHSFIAFGRGIHLCPGRHVGLLAVTSTVEGVINRWHLSRAAPPPRETPAGTLIPSDARISLSARRPVAASAQDCRRLNRG